MGSPVTSNEDHASFLGLPAIPDSLVETAVTYGPWLVLANSVFAIFGVISTLTAASATQGGSGIGTFWLMLGQLATAVLGVPAFIWLRQRRLIGWYTLAAMLGIDALFATLAAGPAALLGGGITIILSLYILVQIKPYYH